jgi:hypothetical protein
MSIRGAALSISSPVPGRVMNSAITAGLGAFAGAAGVYVLPALLGPGWALATGVQLLLIAGGTRTDMPRLAAVAALGGWPLLFGAAAHTFAR